MSLDPSTIIVAFGTLILNFLYTHVYVKMKVDSHDKNLVTIWDKIDSLRDENHKILLTLVRIETELKNFVITKEK